jgi:hypothetical protein
MSEANSPTFREGQTDGEADSLRLSACPPARPMGPAHPTGYPHNMYHRGYASTYHPRPCRCDGSCRVGEQR